MRALGILLGTLSVMLPELLLAATEGASSVPQRDVFRLMHGWPKAVFYVVGLGTCVLFALGCFKQYKKYSRGRPAEGRLAPLVPRIMEAIRTVGSHVTVKRNDPVAGFGHALVYWGFVVLLIATTIVAFDEDFIQILFGSEAKLLVGGIYLWFSLFADLGGLALVVGLFIMFFRRYSSAPAKLDYTRVDLEAGDYDRSTYQAGDRWFLLLLIFIAISGFFIEAARIASEGFPSFEAWSVVGWVLAKAGVAVFDSDALFILSWVLHVAAVLGFIAYIPYSKAMHIVTDILTLASRDEKAAIALTAPPEDAESPGITAIEDFSWRELMMFDACTKCGRCHDVCPARLSGAPLSPRDLILDLREASNKSFGNCEIMGSSRPGIAEGQDLTGGYIDRDTLWSCTSCRACVEHWPVGIEHLPVIVSMRRELLNKGDLDDLLQDALKGLDEKGNSFGQSGNKRPKWSKPLDFKIPNAQKEAVDYLWFVGDVASYNEDCQDVSRTVAKVLKHLDVSFGIMHKAEKSAGNDVRRAGEEGLFEALVEHNVEQIEKCDFKHIFTTDPHTYNTLKHEYPSLGDGVKILHYSELLLQLVKDGVLKLENRAGSRVTYHDPCYLGRYNGIYETPRELLLACGVEIVEMPRSRDLGACCGAGGGRIWMADHDKVTQRPSENRMDEAVSLGVDKFVVACPKDLTMFRDAVKTGGHEDKMEVKDLADFVADAMGLEGSE